MLVTATRGSCITTYWPNARNDDDDDVVDACNFSESKTQVHERTVAAMATVARICHCPQNSLHSPLIPLHSSLNHSPPELDGVSGESGLGSGGEWSATLPLHSPLELGGVSGESGVELGESGVSSGGGQWQTRATVNGSRLHRN